MKVTFCAYDHRTYVGGPNAWLRRLLPRLERYGVQPKVLFITHSRSEACPTIQALRRHGVECVATRRPNYTEGRVRWVLEQLSEDPPDVFVPNLMVPAYYAARWAREAGIPTVGVLRSDDAFHRGLLSEFVFGAPEYHLSALVCVSRFLERVVREQDPGGTLVRRIPSGAPVPAGTAQVADGKFRLVYLGRLVEQQKQISETTRALCRAAREIPAVEGVIYGDGPARPAVEQILRSEAGAVPVQLVGRLDSSQVQGRLLECHAFVLLSDYEGLPTALMEAMACGVVPICLRIRSGVPELIEHGGNGLLVDDRADDFVTAVQRLRSEPDFWGRLSQAARAKIERGYSIEASTERWAELLWDLKQHDEVPRSPGRPRELNLPAVHPDLAREDRRRPALPMQMFQQLRWSAGRVKRRLLGR